MTITKTDIFKGSLIASIMHAIITNKYPELAYEHSWDGANYSIQNSSGLRGTITFDYDFCIGAIRNDNCAFYNDPYDIQQYLNHLPFNIAKKANEETLQYLLINNSGIVEPRITSIFWADDTNIHFDKKLINNVKKDLILIEDVLLPEKIAIDRWGKYYELDSNAMRLFNDLYPLKTRDFASKVFLNKNQRKLIPGDFINSECVESLRELNIFI